MSWKCTKRMRPESSFGDGLPFKKNIFNKSNMAPQATKLASGRVKSFPCFKSSWKVISRPQVGAPISWVDCLTFYECETSEGNPWWSGGTRECIQSSRPHTVFAHFFVIFYSTEVISRCRGPYFEVLQVEVAPPGYLINTQMLVKNDCGCYQGATIPTHAAFCTPRGALLGGSAFFFIFFFPCGGKARHLVLVSEGACCLLMWLLCGFWQSSSGQSHWSSARRTTVRMCWCFHGGFIRWNQMCKKKKKESFFQLAFLQ